MRFRLEATPGELEQKGDALVKALVAELSALAPDLAERLEKALPPPEQTLKYPALQQLADLTREQYARTLERMVEEIGRVLDRSTRPDARYIEKSEAAEPFYDYTKPVADRDERAYQRVKAVLQRKGYTASDFEYGGALYGYSVNELIEMAHGKPLAKAVAGPFIGPRGGKWADAAHTIPWHEPGEAPAAPAEEKPAAKVKYGRRVLDYPEPTWAKGRGPWRSEIYSFGGDPGAKRLKSVDWLSKMPPRWQQMSAYDLRDSLKATLGDVQAPPGHQLLYRVGAGADTLENKNAGNLEGVADFLGDASERDYDTQVGSTLSVYAIKLPETFETYQPYNRGAAGYIVKAEQIEFGAVPAHPPRPARKTEPEAVEKALPAPMYVGPRGGKWADPQHTISWHEPTAEEARAAVPAATPTTKPQTKSQFIHSVLSKITGSLESAGIPSAIRTKAKRRSGYEVRSGATIGLGGGFFLQWHDWEGKDEDAGVGRSREAAKVLEAAGWATSEVSPGVFQLRPKPKEPAESAAREATDPALLRTALESAIEKHGGKVSPHETDKTRVMVKIPVAHIQTLVAIKQHYHLDDEVKAGGKYAMLPIPKNVFHKMEAAHVAPMEFPKPTPKAALPPYVESGWKPHATVEEATAWAKDQGVDVAYNDLATANQLNRAISEQHPWIQQHVEFLGTASQLHGWADKHPDINKRAMTDAKHKQDLREFSLGGSAIAIAHPTTGKPYRQSVVVVADGWGTAEKYAQKAKGFAKGFTLGGELVDTVRHEFGHVEGFVFRHLYPKGPDGPSAWEVWKKHCVAKLKADKHGVMSDVSQYGATNPHECWAEVSVMRRRGMPLPAWIQAAVDEMEIDTKPWDKMGKVWDLQKAVTSMMGSQCPTCVRYRGNLACDAFPESIPEVILTGQHDHRQPLHGEEKLYRSVDDVEVEGAGELHKALGQGPFIGPRGGKWADPQHTIPWHEETMRKPSTPLWGKYSPKEHVAIARKMRQQHLTQLPKTLDEIRSVVGSTGKVKGRVKELASALGKIVRKGRRYESAAKLQDWTGTRVIHENVDQVKATVEKLRGVYKIVDEDNYIDKPLGQYRSWHLIAETPEGLQFEIQVRTANQNTFADWAHHLYKPTNEVEAAHQDDPEVRQYEKQISAYFWDRDNGREVDKPPCLKVVATTFGCL